MILKEFDRFIDAPTKENFLAVREVVINHEDYAPYSFLKSEMINLLDDGKFSELLDIEDINILLCPFAHFYRRYAYLQISKEKEAWMEENYAFKILEGIESTGDGSLESPFIVTRISDERDFLENNDEEFRMQSLQFIGEKTIDIMTTKSGKELYFDITDCYKQLGKSFPED